MGVLLVSRSPVWRDAVLKAAAMGGMAVAACGARAALARLAFAAAQYSHLLVEQGCADGLLEALMDLAAETSGVDTEMLMLGVSTTAIRPHIGVIRNADPTLVREALMQRPPLDGSPEVSMGHKDLLEALSGSMIEPRYQPIVRVADRKAMSLEVLARLNHPVRGTLLPERFVPQIEDAGLAARLTELISARAFTDLTGPSLAGRGLTIALNFPLDVLLLPEALAQLERQRLAAGVATDRVIIELTESRPVEDFVALRRPLEHLRSLGYRVAIDDAGPAMPGLAGLLDLPFTSLKLDKELVQQIEADGEVARQLREIVDKAHERGMIVVAEGVETTAIWHHVQALGADEAQGFLVARPLPVAAVPVWLESWIGAIEAGA